MDFCHCRGIYHGDLKPENILLKNNIVKLTDFSIKIYEQEHISSLPSSLSSSSPSSSFSSNAPPPSASSHWDTWDLWWRAAPCWVAAGWWNCRVRQPRRSGGLMVLVVVVLWSWVFRILSSFRSPPPTPRDPTLPSPRPPPHHPFSRSQDLYRLNRSLHLRLLDPRCHSGPPVPLTSPRSRLANRPPLTARAHSGAARTRATRRRTTP